MFSNQKALKRVCKGSCNNSSVPCPEFMRLMYGYPLVKDDSTTTTTTTVPIQGYYFWCYNQSPITNSWCENSGGTVETATDWSSTMTSNVIPSGTNMMLFQYGTADVGYSNYYGTDTPAYGPGMLQYASYPATLGDYSTTPYNIGLNLLNSNNTSTILSTGYTNLVGIMFGGGGMRSRQMSHIGHLVVFQQFKIH